GTTTDFDGNYRIETKVKGDSLDVNYTGYMPKKFVIKNGAAQTINVSLSIFSLEVVNVFPGENPAHKIIRRVIARKEQNNKKKLDGYEYQVYNKIEFDLTNIPKDLKNKKAFKPIKFIFDNVDSTNNNGEKPFLPIFMIENLSEYYWRDNPKMKKEVIKASRVTGVENNSVSQVMGDMYQNINVYDNNLLIFGKEFVSPISDNAIFYYKFYLKDSLYIGNTRVYHIYFKPKRKQELVFTGNMWVSDTTFGMKRLEMSIPKDANINFIQGANVIQEYDCVDSCWMLKKDRLVIDFAMREKGTGIYGRKTTSYKNIVVNKPREQGFFKFGDNIEVEDGANKKNETFWAENRHDSLSTNEQKIIKMIDTIQTLPIYRTWVDIFTIMVSGYAQAGNFEIGPYTNLMSYNRLEGPRFRFGGRTSSKFSRWYELAGYVAYGTKDEKFKYSIGFKSFISKKPHRALCGINYKSDLEILGQSQNGFSQDNFFASFFRRTPLNSLTRVEQTNLWYERDWVAGFTTKISFVNRKLSPVGGFSYDFEKANGEIGQHPYIRTSEFRVNTRFAYDEKFISGDFTRSSLGTKYPVVQVNYSHSLKDIYEGQYQYKKLVLKVEDRIRFSSLLGYTDYAAEAGQYWGKAPYPLLELHGGNQTYIYDYAAYNMMNYYEFVSDKYASLAVFHHFEGLLFNKFPLLRKLKWREVVTYKVLFGSVSDKNKKELIFPNTLHLLNGKPYQEVSVGIENIFKVFRVDAFWRLSYTDKTLNPGVYKFGLKAGFQLAF
ncbi:MAG: hypothetical protein IAF38_07295, partial [Bacteroidia bacterium]|nr:hypothetical protein [Bacteroidia bacterium]